MPKPKQLAGLHPALREIAERAIQLGWKVERTGGGHVRFISPDKSVPIQHVAFSPSAGKRAIQNEKARFRRVGLL
jgi:predicted RNA binding protein YcfA (HicA-like mRNA interferase family)